MTGYIKVSLKVYVESVGEDKAVQFLSDFSCKGLNDDVEYFLKHTAIEFEKQQLSRTQLVFASYKKELVLVGYYTLSSKSFSVTMAALSKSLKKKITKFATYDPKLKTYILPAPLIAQLGKNYTNDYNKLITGDELLEMACSDVRLAQTIIGGKVAYLECEDKPELTDFYKRNGFVQFAKRQLDSDETDLKGEYLLQMLKVFKNNDTSYFSEVST